MSAGFASRHVVVFGDLSIDVFLQVQNERHDKILYLIDYIAYGLHLLFQITFSKVSTFWLTDKSETCNAEWVLRGSERFSEILKRC